MEQKNRNRPASRRPDADSRAPERSTPGRSDGGWWLVSQGENVELVSGSQAPSTEVGDGDRLIELEGPYQDEATARARLDRMTTGRHARRQSILAGGDRS